MKRILMASDLSARCDRALRRAVALAKDFGAELVVLTVTEELFHPPTTQSNAALAEKALAEQVAAIPDAGNLKITQRVDVGWDYEDIIRCSEEIGAELIVLGIHRHSRRELFQGTTAERVVRYGSCPVLVVKDPVNGPYRFVTVASDLSQHSEAALDVAARLVPEGNILVLHSVASRFPGFLGRDDQETLMREQRDRATAQLQQQIERVKNQLHHHVPSIEMSFPEGDAHGVIGAEVKRLEPDLLAIGTHGRSGFANAVIGSVAEQLLADAPVDVLVTKAKW
ncbi:MAG: universal stress protein [Filomicrobium sp.]